MKANKNSKHNFLAEVGLICVVVGFFVSETSQIILTTLGLCFAAIALFLAKRK